MFTFRPTFIPRSIVLFGCGGTGGHLAARLAQLSRATSKKGSPSSFIPTPIPLVFCDGDVVEDKNLLRQNFVERDVGKKKSDVLANRYSNAFDVPIVSLPHMITTNSPLRTMTSEGGATFEFGYSHTIFILAVDSAAARREILLNILSHTRRSPPSSDFLSGGRCIIIDAGNEDNFGQVSLYTNTAVNVSKGDADRLAGSFPVTLPVAAPVIDIPLPMYEYIERGTSVQEASCADLPQTLAINNMMAAYILSMVQNLILLKPMPIDTMRFSMSSGGSSEFNTPRRWLSRAYSGYERNYTAGKEGWRRRGSGDEFSTLTPDQISFMSMADSLSATERMQFSIYQMTEDENGKFPFNWRGSYASPLAFFEAYRSHCVKTFKEMGQLVSLKGELSPIPAPPPPTPVPTVVPVMAPIVNEDPPKKELKAPRRRSPTPQATAVAALPVNEWEEVLSTTVDYSEQPHPGDSEQPF